MDVEKTVQGFIDSNKDSIVICNDISCGVVPVDPVLRKWREAVGKSMSALSQNSDEVIRLFCGIPTRVK
jgi:adenosyl cobinamide kinase/adenosyl cobinamide phosphate guanylyltransferase